jgi:AmiR/NasT family two-component response regulator
MTGELPPLRIVWIVDREHWARALLRAELIERGCDAVGYVDIPAALAALQSRKSAPPEVIVLELRGQQLEEDALGRLCAAGAPIVVLGGAVELNDPAVRNRQWAAVLRRPFTIGAVADAVEKLLAGAGPRSQP